MCEFADVIVKSKYFTKELLMTRQSDIHWTIFMYVCVYNDTLTELIIDSNIFVNDIFDVLDDYNMSSLLISSIFNPVSTIILLKSEKLTDDQLKLQTTHEPIFDDDDEFEEELNEKFKKATKYDKIISTGYTFLHLMAIFYPELISEIDEKYINVVENIKDSNGKTYLDYYNNIKLIEPINEFDNTTCPICYTNKQSIIFNPCAHCVCNDCFNKMNNFYECCICKSVIRSTLLPFLNKETQIFY